MFGMLLVNFLGSFAVCPRLLKHSNDYCSYADTIMPQFLFAAGFAMRLSLGKRREASGKMPWGRAVRRILGLALVAIVWYSICDLGSIIKSAHEKRLEEFALILLKREYFQTLLHIAVTSLWILPVVNQSVTVRLSYMVASGSLHLFLSWWFNFLWVYSDPSAIDGGPLGFLTWAIPALCGTLACDAVRSTGSYAALRIAIGGVIAMTLGWGMSIGSVLYDVRPDQNLEQASVVETELATAGRSTRRTNPNLADDPVIPSMARLQAYDGRIVEPPFVPPPDARHRKWNYWMMCQRCGSLSYLTFASGVALVVYSLFLWACDRMNRRLGLFRTLGTNSLAAYIFHDVAGWMIEPFFPKNSPYVARNFASLTLFAGERLGMTTNRSEYVLSLIFALIGFLCFASFVYISCRLLERRGWYIRV